MIRSKKQEDGGTIGSSEMGPIMCAKSMRHGTSIGVKSCGL